MMASQNRTLDPRVAVKHILVERQAQQEYLSRVGGVLDQFPGRKPTYVDDFEATTIARVFREQLGEDRPLADDSSEAVGIGKRVLAIGARRDGRIVEKFTDEKGMICHGFHYLHVMANGCVFNCQYCFLHGSIWARSVPTIIKLNINYEDISTRMREIAADNLRQGKCTRFNMGVMMDSFAFEPTIGFLRYIIPLLGHDDFAATTLILLSKSNEITELLNAARRYPWATKRVLPGFSVNSVTAATRFEGGTAGTHARLAAARQLQSAGYAVRLRIDPVIPIGDWATEYKHLVDLIYREYEIDPQPLLVASLRFDDPQPINRARGRFPFSPLFDLPLTLDDGAKWRQIGRAHV